MNYDEQRGFILGSRMSGGVAVGVTCLLAILCAKAVTDAGARERISYALVTAALAVLIYYTPDYLHLTVSPEKSARWAIKIRWRLVGAMLLFAIAVPAGERVVIAMCAVFLALWNLLATKIPRRFVWLWLYFWVGDVTLLAALLLTGRLGPLIGVALVAAAAHLALTTYSGRQLAQSVLVIAVSVALVWVCGRQFLLSVAAEMAQYGLVLGPTVSTVLLVLRAQRQNEKNVATAMAELKEFTGYAEERIRELWATSNQQLAENWKNARLDEGDAERMAEWYRQNSELYLFAISGYNLEYKRIRSTLNILRLANGRCLDYGAGNGEVLLELARRGHAATYYDVEGQTMRFARFRAQRRGLKMEFFCAKADLAGSAERAGFDTIFSLDVLEHLPDLKGELSFLASLLNPGGLMVFDVPAGATHAHPMHLNHQLDVVGFLRAKGMRDERNLWRKLPFKKEEKYFFRAGAQAEFNSSAG